MSAMIPWQKELERLDEAIHQIANRPVELNESGTLKEARALLLEILRAFESATDEERGSIRNLVSAYQSFFWAATPPDGETAVETLRLRLVHFALIDQYPDARDAVLWLQDLCETPGISLQTLASLRREVAPMASDVDRFGFGSTRSMLLKGYRSGYGKRGAPEAED